MQAVMSIEEVASVVPSTITWREPVEVGQVRGADSGTNRASAESPRGPDSPAHGGHLSDGDTPASVKVATRTRFHSGGSLGHGYGGLRSSSSSPNLAVRDQDQTTIFTETTKIIGIQARLQEKPFGGGGVPDSVMMPLVADSPGSPQVSRQTIKSRARPRRAEEPTPFLSVDNLPVDKVLVEGKQHSRTRPSSDPRKLTSSSKKRPDPLLNGAGRKTRSPPQSAYTPPVPRSPSRAQSRGTPSATPYNYNSFFTHKSSAFLAGPPNLWSMGNKYWPQHGTPNDRQKLAPLPQTLAAEALAPKPNTQVSQPFKHDVDSEVPVDRPVSPSQDLKERTIYALREVTRALNRPQSPPPSRKGGRLLKGRLKPLHTFKLAGPSIDTCRGIQPEEQEHAPSDSRMLQRKRELLGMLPPDIFQPRPMTGESIHRTSIVSQLSTDREKDLDDESRKAEGGTVDQLSSQVLSGVRMPPNSLASLSDENVSYLQDALTSHIDIPESSRDKEEAAQLKEENSEVPEDRSRVPQISEAYATSYESGSKIDVTSQQVEEISDSGDAPAVAEKAEEEEEVVASSEVKATMSDYMNEGGAARVLSDMVQRVTNSAKKSTVEEDTEADQKYNTYFADSETRSETPTSRTGSSTLMRRRSSMDDMEMDQASCELTDMVSEDGLGEDGSVKQAGKDSAAERGSLASLSKVKLTNPEDEMANNDIECQSREDLATPTNEDFQRDSPTDPNLAETSPPDRPTEENKDLTASTLHTYIDSGLVENAENSTTDSRVDTNQDYISPEDVTADQTGEPNLHICEDETNLVRAGSTDENNIAQNDEQKLAEEVTHMSSDDAKSGTETVTTEPEVQDQAGETEGPTQEAAAEAVPTVQIEVTGPELELTSKEEERVSNLLNEQGVDTRQSVDVTVSEELQTPEETEIMVDKNIAEGKDIINSEECNGERTELPDEDDKLEKEEDGNEDAQDDQGSSCHSNKFKRDDEDQDGSQGGQGGSHGNSSGSANGNAGNSNTSGEVGDGNVQSDPTSGVNSSGTQQRSHETAADSQYVHTVVDSESNIVNKVPSNVAYGSYEDYDDDDIPDIDEPALFCGICGLDEDTCLCPHSTFNEKLGSQGHRPTIKSASAVEDKKYPSSKVSSRSFSASGGLHSRQQNGGPFESWREDTEIEKESIQNHLILEYQAMIENPRHEGFLSQELSSARFAGGVFMRLQGTKVKCESRQSSCKGRPLSSNSKSEFSDDRTDHSENCVKSHDGIGQQNNQSECNMVSGDLRSDSGCWSETQGAVTAESEESSKENVTESASEDKQNLHQQSLEAESLEVAGKPLTKPRHPKESSLPAAPLPAPLCFRVNAKPPPGYLYYFAYGSDMNKSRMSSYIGREADHRLWGVLFGFTLTFNKRGADLAAGGFPNIVLSPDSSVEGCVYLITPSELQMLDQHIGCPEFYTKAMFPVWMMNCAEPDELGVAQYCIPALTYVAQDKWTLSQEEEEKIECNYSIGQCLKGSDLLTPSYVQHISSLRVH